MLITLFKSEEMYPNPHAHSSDRVFSDKIPTTSNARPYQIRFSMKVTVVIALPDYHHTTDIVLQNVMTFDFVNLLSHELSLATKRYYRHLSQTFHFPN